MTEDLSFATLQTALAAEFDETFTDTRGGVTLTYITGEQVISRLNDVLGVFGWDFAVREHGYNQEADEIWVLGRLTVYLRDHHGPEPLVTREQFGSQKLRRSRNTDAILDIGFDLKGATTDALKKCASLVGVGLYLSHKDPPPEAQERPPQPQRAAEPPRLTQETARANGGALRCQVCGEELQTITFRDGTHWSPDLLASYGRRKHQQVLCMKHYREANERAKGGAAPPPAPSAPAYEPEQDAERF